MKHLKFKPDVTKILKLWLEMSIKMKTDELCSNAADKLREIERENRSVCLTVGL